MSFHNRNPLWNENTLIGRIVAMMALIVIVPIGLMVMNIEKTSQEVAKKGFKKGDFTAIFVVEENAKANTAIGEHYAEIVKNPRLTVFKEDFGLREVWSVPPSIKPLQNLPSPMYVQRLPNIINGYPPTLTPIYGVFKQPNAIEKFKSWCKENDYQNHDFQMDWDQQNYTKEVIIEKKGSKLNFTAFYKGNDQLSYIWDGSKIIDLSDSEITGQVGGEKGKQHYVQWLKFIQKLGK